MKDLDTASVAALPQVRIESLDPIADHLQKGQEVVIHRNFSMALPYGLEVVARRKQIEGVPKLCIAGTFAFIEATQPETINELRELCLDKSRIVELTKLLGVTATYTNNQREALRLALEGDSSESVTAWFSSSGKRPYLCHVSNERREKNGQASSTPPKYDRLTLKDRVASFMTLLSVVDRALGSKSDGYTLNLVDKRTPNQHQNEITTTPKQKNRRQYNKKNPSEKQPSYLEKKAASLDELYRPQVPNPNVRLQQVHGIDPTDLAKINRRIRSMHNPKLAEQYGIQGGSGILFFGEGGNGKTMAAVAIANEVGGRIWQISGEDIVEKWVGNSAKNANSLFSSAIEVSELGPLVLLFDEFDATITSRSSDTSERLSALGAFKEKIAHIASEVPNILLIATTNNPENIDKPLRRRGRFDVHVYMRPPDKTARASIFKDQITEEVIDEVRLFDASESFNFEKLAEASEGLTGADIASVFEECRLQAFDTHMEVGSRMLLITEQDILEKIRNIKEQSHEF